MKSKDYKIKEKGIKFMEQVKEILENQQKTNESSEYTHYLGIQLDPEKNKYSTNNIGLNLISSIKSFLQGFTSPVYSAVGLEVDDILESEINAYLSQAKALEVSLSGSFSSMVKSITTEELLYVVAKTFSTRANNSDI